MSDESASSPAIEVSRNLKEVIVWRYVAELMRRHPDRLWVCQAEKETWDRKSQPNLVRVAIAFPDYEERYADFDLIEGDTVRFHTVEGFFEMPGIWEMTISGIDLHGVLNHLTNDIGITDYVHGQIPTTTPTSLVYRAMAGLAASVAFHNHSWRWMNAVKRAPEDWHEAALRRELLRPFPSLDVPEPRYTDIANARTDPAYRYWVLARDEEPVACLTLDGYAHLLNGPEFDLMALYDSTRREGSPGRMGPVVGAIGKDFLP